MFYVEAKVHTFCIGIPNRCSFSLQVSATELGMYKNLDEAAKTVELPDTYTPKKQNHKTYMKHFAIFERLSVKLFDEFEAIAVLQQKAE